MIVFDLACDGAHVFEAWFGSSEDYEAQRTRGLLACPLCGSTAIEKAPMTPSIGRKGNQLPAPIASANTAVPAVTVANEPPAYPPEQVKAMLEAVAKAQAEMLSGSEYVGSDFSDKARAMHLGETDQRSIHGQTSIEEAKSLIEEGVPVMPLPLPIRPPGSTH